MTVGKRKARPGNVHFSLHLTPELAEELAQHAQRDERSMSSLLRLAAREYLDNHRNQLTKKG